MTLGVCRALLPHYSPQTAPANDLEVCLWETRLRTASKARLHRRLRPVA